MCWQGEGLFIRNVYWGSDLPLIGRLCHDLQDVNAMSTMQAYCSDHALPPLNAHDPSDYSTRMW